MKSYTHFFNRTLISKCFALVFGVLLLTSIPNAIYSQTEFAIDGVQEWTDGANLNYEENSLLETTSLSSASSSSEYISTSNSVEPSKFEPPLWQPERSSVAGDFSSSDSAASAVQAACPGVDGLPCLARRWDRGDSWEDVSGSTLLDKKDVGIIACANAAGTDSNIGPNTTYCSANFEITGDLTSCMDPDVGAPINPVSVTPPIDGQPILWFNFDVRAFAASSEFQIIGGPDNIAWALYYSNSPTESNLTPGVNGNLSGDCNDLTFDQCGTNFTGWADTPFTVPEFPSETNYYVMVWDQDATNNYDFSIVFKARYGCGDTDFCKLEQDGPEEVVCSSDGSTYSVTVNLNGINGSYRGIDANANTISSDVCLTNPVASPATTTGSITFTYDIGESYNIEIVRVADCGLTVVNGSECTLTGITGSSPTDCCTPSVTCKSISDIDIEGCADDIPAAITDPSSIFDYTICGSSIVTMTSNDAGDTDFCSVDGDGYDFIRTYTLLLDGVAQSPTCEQNIIIQDTKDPIIECPTDIIDLGCTTVVPTGANALAAILTKSDNCGVKMTVANGGTITGDCQKTQVFTVTVSDYCNRTASCDITFTWNEDTDKPIISTPAINEDLGCNPSSIAAPTFTVDDECNVNAVSVVTTDGPTGLPCSRTQTWKATYSNTCYTSDEISITYTWTISENLALQNVPTNVVVNACTDPTEQFNNWILDLENISASGGCEAKVEFDKILADLTVSSSVCNSTPDVITVKINASDDCGSTEPVTATFTVPAYVDNLVLDDCPKDEDFPTCSDQTAVTNAFNAWVSDLNAMSATGGCGREDVKYSVLPSSLATPDVCSTTATNYSVTVSVKDACGSTEECTATFKVAAYVDDLQLTDCPDNVSFGTCSDQTEVTSAFNAWVSALNAMSATGGCGTEAVKYSVSPSSLAAPDVCSTTGTDYSVTVSVKDACGGTEECTSTFKVAAYADDLELVGECPADNEVDGCSTNAEIDAAFDAWKTALVANFSATGGCNAKLSFSPGLSTLQAPEQCATTDQVISVDVKATDDCGEPQVTTCSFTLKAFTSTLVVDVVDDEKYASCDYATQEDVDLAFEKFLDKFGFSGDCDASASGLENLTAPDLCEGGTVSVSYKVTDLCENKSEDAKFTITPSEAIVIECPDPVSLPSSSTQQDIQTAYDTWVAGFSHIGGCNTDNNSADIPKLPSFDCGTEVDLSFTYKVTDRCNPDGKTCTSTFFVPGVTGLSVDCPKDVLLDQCTEGLAIVAAFDNWIAGFAVNDGDNPTTNLSSLPTYTIEDYKCGIAVDFSFTLNATDACTPDGVSCTSTFKVKAADALTLSQAPADVTTDACEDPSAKFTAWIASLNAMTADGGCTPTVEYDQILSELSVDGYCKTTPQVITVKINAKDKCGETIPVSSTFTVPAYTNDLELVGECPADNEVDGCSTNAEIDAAFDAWKTALVANFSATGGCNAKLSFSPGLSTLQAPEQCATTDQVISVDVKATDDCGEPQVTTCSFTLKAFTSTLVVDVVDDEKYASCDYATQEDVDLAFEKFLDKFGFSGDCDASASGLENLTAPDLCEGGTVSVSYKVTDLCENKSEDAKFTITPSEAIVIECPDPVSLPSSSTQQDIQTAYDTWVAGFSHIGGCNTDNNSADIPKLPSFDCGTEVDLSFTYKVTDRCNPDGKTCTSTFFVPGVTGLSVDCPKDVLLDQCTEGQAIVDAFDNWIAGFAVNDGDNPTTNLSSLPTYTIEDYKCGIAVDFSFTLNATDACTPDGVSCTSTFKVKAADALTLSQAPADVTTDACEDPSAKFTAWIASLNAMTADGGCTPTVEYDQILSELSVDGYCKTTPQVITVKINAKDKCGETIPVSSTFTVPAYTNDLELVGECPADNEVDGCSTNAEIDAAFDAWKTALVANFSAKGGCKAKVEFSTVVADLVAPKQCANFDQVISVGVKAIDDCGETQVTTCSFILKAFKSTLVVDVVDDESYASCDYVTQEDVDLAFEKFLDKFGFTGDCDASASGLENLTAPDLCEGGTVSVSYKVTDLCETKSEDAKFTITPSEAIVIACPNNVNLPSSSTQQDIQTAYDAWVKGFSHTGGCNTFDNSADIPKLPSFDCGTEVDLSFTYKVTDRCNPDGKTCSSTFFVPGVTGLSVDCPKDVLLDQCTEGQAIVDAFDNWIAGFAVNDGDNPTTNLSSLPKYTIEDYKCGIAVDFSFTLNAKDACTPDGVSCTSTFKVKAADALTLSQAPADVTTDACEDPSAKFTAWIASLNAMTADGGCTPTVVYDQILSELFVDGYCKIKPQVITVKINAKDKCGETIPVSSTFTVPAYTNDLELVGECPANNSVDGCSTDAEIEAAFDAWKTALVDNFSAKGGCKAKVEFSTVVADLVAPKQCADSDQVISVGVKATDECGETQVTTCSFTLKVFKSTLFVDVVDDEKYASCDFATQDDINNTFLAFIKKFGYEGGCDASGSDLSGYRAPDLCEGGTVNITYVVKDLCETKMEKASFTITPSEALIVSCPSNVSLESSSTEDEIIAAYNKWKASFSYQGGCDVSDNANLIPQLPSYDCGNEVKISFTYIAEDRCNPDGVSCTSTFFVPGVVTLTVDCPQARELDACSTAQEIVAAFNSWKDGFAVNYGDNPSSNISQLPTYTEEDFKCGEALNIAFTLTATDACNPDGVSCTSTFKVKAAEELTLSPAPADVTTEACEDPSVKFAAWIKALNDMNADGGCTPTVEYDKILDELEVSGYCTASEQVITVMIKAKDLCGETTPVSSTFTVPAYSNDLELSAKPADVSVEPCTDPAEQFKAWITALDAMKASGGCNAEVVYSVDLSTLSVDGYCNAEPQIVSVDIYAKDDCGETQPVTATFTVPAYSNDLALSAKPTDVSVEPCTDPAEQFKAWITALDAMKASGGCNAEVVYSVDLSTLSVDGYCNAEPQIVSVDIYAKDDCAKTQPVTATFTVPAYSNDLELSAKPADVTVKPCTDPAEQFKAWITALDAMKASGGCNPEVVYSTPLGQLSLENYCFADEQTISVDIHAVDDCAKTFPVTATFKVSAGKDKPIISTNAQSGDLGCNPTFTPPVFTIDDECNPNALASIKDSGVIGEGCDKSQTWTATYFNDCFTAEPVIITYNWTEDKTIPVITSDMQSKDLGCNPTIVAPTFSVTDNCDGGEIIEEDQGDGPQIIAESGSIDFDSKGNINTNSQVLLDNGDLMPVITIEGPTAGEDCSFSQTWTANYTDACGNIAETVSVTYTWTEDTDKPVITPLSDGGYLGCEPEVIPVPVFSVSDNCMGDDITILGVPGDILRDDCLLTQTFTADYTDNCKNIAESASVTYTWKDPLEDLAIGFVNPMLIEVGDGGTLTIQCFGQNPEWSLPEASLNDVTISGGCGVVTPSVSEIELEDGECATDGFIKRFLCSWSAIDECDNEVSLSIIMEVVDEIPPLIFGVPDDVTVNCDAIPDAPTVTATDECLCADVEMTESAITEECLDGQVITRTWTASDCCGNVTVETQTITLTDKQAPELVVSLPTGLDIKDNIVLDYDCNKGGIPDIFSSLSAENAAALEGCSGDPTISFASTFTVYNGCSNGVLDEESFTWTAVDACGNAKSIVLTLRTIDTTPPQIIGLEDKVCEADMPFIYAVDNCTNATMEFFDQDIDGGCGNEFLRTYRAYDQCGNSIIATQIIIGEDNTAPEIELTNPLLVNAESGDTIKIEQDSQIEGRYTNFGINDANFIDECGNDLSTSFNEEILLEADCDSDQGIAFVKATWTAVDYCGNESSMSVFISIIDTQAPVLVGFEPQISVACSREVPAIKAVDNSGQPSITIGETVIPGDCPGNYQIERSIFVEDACGNSISATQMVTVVDQIGPVISGVEAFMCEDLSIPEVTALDDCSSESLPVTMVQDTLSNEDCTNEILIRRIWSATDLCGNTTEVEQVISFNDNTAPDLIYVEEIKPFVGKSTEVMMSDLNTIALIEEFDWYSITSLDRCPGQVLRPEYTYENTFSEDCAAEGFYEKRNYTWVFTDACGNVSTEDMEIVIVDDVAPVLINLPLDEDYGCNGIPLLGNLTPPEFAELMDSMTGSITFTEVELTDETTTTITNTYTAVDMCGNVTVVEQLLSAIVESDIACSISSNPNILCNSHGNVLTANVTGGEGPYTYEWEIEGKDCQIQAGQSTESIEIYVGFSDVKVTLLVTDSKDCVTECEIDISCISKGQVIDVRSIDTEEVNEVKITTLMPNPASEKVTFTVHSDTQQNMNYSLVNMMNQKILTNNTALEVGENSIDLNINEFESGIYYILVENDESSDIKRFIKVR